MKPLTGTSPPADMVQLGSWDIRSTMLDGPGTTWPGIIAGHPPLDPAAKPWRAGDGFPEQGWRVVHRDTAPWASEILVLAAPSTVRPGHWITVQLHRSSNGWVLAAPSSNPLVPTKRRRSRGLRLAWAASGFSMPHGEQAALDTVLVNGTGQPWAPAEEDFAHLHGIIHDSRGRRLGTGGIAYGRLGLPPFPELLPGGRATLQVTACTPALSGLPAGRYLVLAYLPSLDLRTPDMATLTVHP
ncbi:hypothetical protein AB0N71_08825 [Pseudarthrobacter enclensis]|uniref:hypothetical protein n=1 Tax=Pseudarthrobacter enclensis TaxID=993070 RepID=UPI003429EC5D